MSGRQVLVLFIAVLLILGFRLKAPRVDSAAVAAGTTVVLGAGAQPADGPSATPIARRRAEIEPALRDPFATARPAPPPAAVQAPSLAPPAVPTAPTPPAPPTPGLVFAGRMVTPDGTTVVMASLGNDTLILRTGQLLSDGFRVEAIEADAVQLSHPALSQPARLAIPPAPRLQTR